MLDIVSVVGTTRRATQEEVAEATVEQCREEPGKADLLTASAVANILGVSVSTLIVWLDAGDEDKAPPAIKRGTRYVFRPALLVPWLEAKRYRVPGALRERAARDAA